MRAVIFAVLALLLLGGGGAGAYFYFMQPAGIRAGEAEGANHAAKKDGHGRKHGEHTEYVELDPLILPIVDKSGVSQVVSVVIALEVADGEAAKKVEHMTPRLKDAYIQDMYGVLNKQAAMKGGVIQVSYIKKRLNEITAKLMGEGVVQDVLLQVVQQRPA